MKRIICCILGVLLLTAIPCSAASAKAMILIEASSGRVLDAYNEQTQMPMASLTKIMTAMTVIQHADLNEIVTVTKESVGIEGSSMYLKTGDKYSVEQLLYGLLLVSGNDAATALAIHTGGSVEKFATMMNETAQELGLENSHFINPSGLDAQGHYTTAFDLAKLTAVALKNETFAKIVATNQMKVNGVMLTNHNRLLRELEGCIGVKTGYTKACGRCLVSAVERDGVVLICVTLSCPDDWNVHKELYAKNFPRCERVILLSEKAIYRSLAVAGGHDVGYYCPDVYGVVIDGNRDFSVSLQLPKFIYAHKKSGEAVGKLTVCEGTTAIACADLVLDRDTKLLEVKKSIFRKLLLFLLHLFGF